MQRVVSRIRTRKGFTLVELAVVIVIIGVLAAFGVPRFLQSVEKSKASEAFNYLSAIQSAEERVPGPERHVRQCDLEPRHPTAVTAVFHRAELDHRHPRQRRESGLVADAHAQREFELRLYGQLDADRVRYLEYLDDHDLPADLPGDRDGQQQQLG